MRNHRLSGAMITKASQVFLLQALALLLGCCLAAAGGVTRMEASGDAGLTGVLELNAYPLRTMTVIPFRLLLRDAEGGALAGAPVTCDLDMPAMPMPRNRPRVQPCGDAYQGIAVFTMAGAWTASFQAELPGGGRAELVFNIEEVLLK